MSLNKRKCCHGCLLDQFIWKNHDGKKYCLSCWNKIKPLPIFKPKVKKPISHISENKKVQFKKYKKARTEYFLLHPTCEFPGCSSTEVDLHHRKGRIGSLLTDKRYFCSLCRHHHIYVENNPEEAIKLGLSIKRLDI